MVPTSCPATILRMESPPLPEAMTVVTPLPAASHAASTCAPRAQELGAGVGETGTKAWVQGLGCWIQEDAGHPRGPGHDGRKSGEVWVQCRVPAVVCPRGEMLEVVVRGWL